MQEMLKHSHFQIFTRKQIKRFVSIVTRKEQKRSHSGYLKTVKQFWWSMLNNIFWRKTALIVVGLESLALLIIIRM